MIRYSKVSSGIKPYEKPAQRDILTFIIKIPGGNECTRYLKEKT